MTDGEETVPEEGTRSGKLGIEFSEEDSDRGFRAYTLHNIKVEALIEMWMRASQLPMDEDDQLVLQELRHQIKILLADHTHDRYLKAVSMMSTAEVCSTEE
jgi:hypothetical protein